MNIYGWNINNSILSIRTYINTSIILLPIILLSFLSSTLIRTIHSLWMIISSYSHLALTWVAGIAFACLMMCSAISFHVGLLNSTKNILGLCPCCNLKAFDRQQLYDLWPYLGSLIICLRVYNPTYCSFNWFWWKVHLTIDVRMCHSVRPPCVSMKSTAPRTPLYQYTWVGAVWVIEWYGCLSTPSESQP